MGAHRPHLRAGRCRAGRGGRREAGWRPGAAHPRYRVRCRTHQPVARRCVARRAHHRRRLVAGAGRCGAGAGGSRRPLPLRGRRCGPLGRRARLRPDRLAPWRDVLRRSRRGARAHPHPREVRCAAALLLLPVAVAQPLGVAPRRAGRRTAIRSPCARPLRLRRRGARRRPARRRRWHAPHAVALDFGYVAGAGADPVADATSFFRRIGPTAIAFRHAGPADRDRLSAGLESLVREFVTGGRVVFPAAAWIWSATA